MLFPLVQLVIYDNEQCELLHSFVSISLTSVILKKKYIKLISEPFTHLNVDLEVSYEHYYARVLLSQCQKYCVEQSTYKLYWPEEEGQEAA